MQISLEFTWIKFDIARSSRRYECFSVLPQNFMLLFSQYQNGFPTISTMRDSISPVLKVLCSMSTHCRWIRRYFRQIVLPPLNDVSKRPEEGNSIRNRLCHLLTSPEDSVSTMVAEFLFILCKENGMVLVQVN